MTTPNNDSPTPPKMNAGETPQPYFSMADAKAQSLKSAPTDGTTPRVDAHIIWQNEQVPFVTEPNALIAWCGLARKLERELAQLAARLVEVEHQRDAAQKAIASSGVIIGTPPEPQVIDAPAVCSRCGMTVVSPTTGKLLNRCLCGGELKTTKTI